MPKKAFVLPQGRYQELAKLITAYYEHKSQNYLTLSDIKEMYRTGEKDISRYHVFLVKIGILEGNNLQKKLTDVGKRLGRAIAEQDSYRVMISWREVVKNVLFFRKLTSFLKLQKHISDTDLMSQIFLLADPVTFRNRAIIGAHTIISILEFAGYIESDQTRRNKRFYRYVFQEKSPFVNSERLDSIRSLKSELHDLSKLVRFCEELDSSYDQGNYYATILLLRSLINHIPPIFGFKTFNEVSSNYNSKSSSSFKDAMKHLNESSRKVADAVTHLGTRQQEELINRTQVNYSQDLDILLEEIVRILK